MGITELKEKQRTHICARERNDKYGKEKSGNGRKKAKIQER